MLILAFRNVFRNRRRTFITLFLVISGTFLLAAMRFIAYGFQQDMISQAVQLESGFLEVAAYGWNEKKSLERALEVTPRLLEKISTVEGIQEMSPRIRGGALLNFGDETRFVSVLAADPKKEKHITTIHRVLEKGTLPEDGRVYGAMMGFRLARSLGMDIGSRFFLISSHFDGSLGAIQAQIVGIYRANQSGLDSSRVGITLNAGEDLFGTRFDEEGKVYYTTVALKVEDYLAAQHVKKLLREVFPPPIDPGGGRPEISSVYDPVILDWKDLNPSVIDLLNVAQWKMDVFLLFFVLSISFGVLNTVQMSIQERIREFGVLLAIGTGQRNLMAMILWEVFFLIVPGVCLGILSAAALGQYLHYNPIELSGVLAEVYESMGARARYKPIVEPGELWTTSVSLILPSFLAGLFAARRVFRLDPVSAINII